MSEQKRLSWQECIDQAAQCVPYTLINDLPLIRQTINDLCDSYRKDGYRVRDFDQDATVLQVRRMIAKINLEAVCES